MPVFFLSTTTEFFEFNKLALLTLATVALTLIWGLRVLMGQKIEFVKSKIDLPLIIFTGVLIAATVFSVNKTTSIYGSQGRWFPGLFAFLVMILFYYVATPTLRVASAAKWMLLSFVFGSTVSSLVAILSYYNVFIGAEAYFKATNFTLTGSVTTAMVLAAVALAMTLGLLATEKKAAVKYALLVTVAINFFYVALSSSLIGWVLLGVGALAALFLTRAIEISNDKATLGALMGTILVITLLVVFPATRNVIRNKAYPYEVNLGVRESWVVAAATIQDYPLLATGPSTFYINYTRYRPLNMNNGALWNVRFDKPFNEVLNVLGTMGILGLAAYIFFAVASIKVALATRSERDALGLNSVLAVGILTLTTAFLFTYATILNMFVLFMFLSLTVALSSAREEVSKQADLVSFSFSSFSAMTTSIGAHEASAVKKEYMNLILVAPVIAASIYGSVLFYKTYAAEYYMRRAIVSAINNKATDTYDFQAKAINMNPQRDVYHTAYAQTNLVLANALAAKQNLTDADKQTIQTLIAQAIRSSRVATEVVNPLNVANWQTRALIYRSLINVADNATDWAIGSYNTAIQLDPTNPALRLDLGGIYYTNKDFLSAANLFRQATALKQDYANAHYNFAASLNQLKDYANAKRELEITKTLIPSDSEDYKRVNEEITAMASQAANVAGSATNKPTVEQLAGDANKPANQEPLSNPGSSLNQPNGIPNANGSQPATTVPVIPATKQ